MRSILFAATAIAAVVSSPALANEGRVELRNGIIWANGVSDEAVGLALGYDADVSDAFFVGIESTIDTNFDFVSPVLGVNARLGTNIGESGRFFGTVGYAYDTDFDIDDFAVGGGYQHTLNGDLVISAQYQRYLDLDINRVSVGVGARF
jgi:outer membrane immunogenic protein